MDGSDTGAGSHTFQVKMSARAASDAELLDHLRRVACVVGGAWLTRDEYTQRRLDHPTTILRTSKRLDRSLHGRSPRQRMP